MKTYTVEVEENGTRKWYLNGRLHREGGPAIEYANGTRGWYLNGVLHREDGPAVEYADGTNSWYLNGKLHREDGPAIEGDNTSTKYYYLNNKRLTEQEFLARTANTVIGITINGITYKAIKCG